MALKSLSDILLALVPFLFLFLQSQSQSAPAPAPTPKSSSSPVNLTGILEKNGQFTIFIRLITQTQVANQIVNQNNSSNEGMTIFAPTDNAFNNLKAGALNSLSYNQQVQLILYHVLPNYYTMISLLTVPNPVRTQATGQDGKPYGLNFIGKQNQVHVSTGVVQTQINNALRQQFPLALYPLDKVLLPEELFGENSPPTSSPGPTKTPMDKESPKNNAADGPSSASENQTGDSSNKNIGFAFVTGLCFIVFLGFIVN